MKNLMWCILVVFVSLAMANTVSAQVWAIVSSDEVKEKVAYTSGHCSVSVMRSGDVVVVAQREQVTQVITFQKGETRSFWISRIGKPTVSTSGPNLIGQCLFEILPSEVQQRLQPQPLLAKK